MPHARWSRTFALLAVIAIVGGCAAPSSGSPGASVLASVAPSASPADLEGKFDVGGYSLWIHCQGTGAPTVVIEAGLGGDSSGWRGVADGLESVTRVCVYDRAGLRKSDIRPGLPSTSAGQMADELARLLVAANQPAPYVLVGHSYGGMLARLFAYRHATDVEGLVLVDASSLHQFEAENSDPNDVWGDGGTKVDREASLAELAAVDTLGEMPLVVLTQGQLNGDFERLWAGWQDELAALSSNALHMVAHDSGHMIQEEKTRLVIESISVVVEAARAGGPLPACGARLTAVGAECLEATMTGQLDAWDELRAAVVPTAGDLPDGVYKGTATGAEVAAVSGHSEDFSKVEFTFTLQGGHWNLSQSMDGGAPEEADGVYGTDGGEATFVWPLDWKIPRTPGVNRATWTVDADGTLHFQQDDEWAKEAWLAFPWVRIGDVPGG